MSNLIKNLLTFCLFLLLSSSLVAQAADLKLEYETSPSPAIINVGDTLQVRYEVSNTGSTDATGSQMTINLSGDFQVIETSSTTGTFAANVWNIGTVPSEESEVLLVFITKTSEGLGTLEAEITQMTGGGPDPDSTPNSEDANEDDFQSFCISTIKEFYQPQIVTLGAGSGMTGVQWFKNDTLIVGADSVDYDATEEGIYYFNSDGSPCELGGCCPIQLKEVPPPPCSVIAVVSEIACNDNGTPTVDTDDYITFKITTSGESLSSGFTLSADNGTITKQDGAVATGLLYGTDTLFRMQNGAAGAGDIEIVITDNTDGACKDTMMITDTGVCSTPVCNMVLSLVPEDCDVGDNTYDLTGTVVFAAPPTTGTLTILVDGVAQQTINAPFSSPQNITITGLISDGLLHSVTSSFSEDAACMIQMSYNAPAPCMISSTCSVSASVNIGTCESASNTYDVTGNLTFSDAPATGTLKVAIGPFEQVFSAPFSSPQAYTISGLVADGSGHDLVVTFSEDTFCRFDTTYIAPAGCDPVACGITATAIPGTCIANRFDLTGQITFINAPTTGDLMVSLGGETQTFSAPFTSPRAYTFTDLLADGSTGKVMVQFSEDLVCAATIAYTAPVACDLVACAVSLNLTPSACSDNTYSLNGNIAMVNAPTTGTLTIAASGTTYLTVAMPSASPISFVLPGLPANGQQLVFDASFSADGACTDTFTVQAPATCVGTCNVSTTVADVQCNDNGSDTSTDDYITFELNPTGTNLGGTYNVTSTAGPVFLMSGALAVNVPYGQATTYRFANGSAGGGDLTINIQDNSTPNCVEGPLTIPDPDICSCKNPIGVVTTSQTTCNGSDANTDGMLIITNLTVGTKINYSTGTTYSGNADYANALTIGTLPDTIVQNLTNPTDSQAYTIRIFNEGTNCFVDTTLYLYEKTCICTDPILSDLTDESICVGESFTATNLTTSVTNSIPVTYQWYNNNGTDNAGTAIIAGQTTAALTSLPTNAGVYSYKVVATNIRPGGCSAEKIVNLTIIPTATGFEIYNGCREDGYEVVVGSITYNQSNPTGMQTLTAVNGCDSVVTVSLVFKPNATGTATYDGCEGDGYEVVIGGNTYNEANPTGMETITAANGCDSVVTINLTFKPNTTGTEDYDGCEGDGYSVIVGSTTYNEANPTGTETLTAESGCDSIVTVNLVFTNEKTNTVTYEGCENDGYSVVVGSTTYDENNPVGTESLTAASGCDSVVTINLVFNPNTNSNVAYEGCEDDGYTVIVGSTIYDKNNPSGTEVLTNANGCDSTVTVNLVFNEEKASEITHLGCIEDGYEVVVNGTVYSEVNPIGVERFTAVNGCDSIVTINLTFNPLSDNACGIFDLALEKSTDSSVVRLGDLVVYQIKVTNEGDVDAYNIGISDFIPAGMSLADENWTASGDTARFNTPISFLPAGTDFNLYITLKVNLDFTGTTLVNFAEISEVDDDEDPTNTPPTDEDSTPDEDPTNPDEDDDDSAVVNVIEEGEEVFDLALIETLAPGQSGMVKPGDEVNLKITIFNQGTLPTETIKITQYLPADVTLNNNNPQGWTAMNDSTAMITLTAGNGLPIGGLAPDSMIMVMIQVVIDENTTAIKLTPHAEISDDGANNDNDSTPDDDRTNDAGGQSNTDTDNASDQIAPIDEDDSDPVQIMLQQFDLALTEELLTEELLTEGPIVPGDSITGKIKIFNQGEIAADNIKLFAYIPAGLQLDDDRWTAMDDSTAMLTLTVAGGDLPTEGLTPDEMTMVTIGFTIDPTFMDTCLITYAEIGGATDENGNPTNDVDSTPDGDSTNDTGGEVHTSTDNKIFSTPPTDEDDHDPMKIAVKQTFDLALEKSTDSTIVRLGDLVTYQLKITNEGTVDAYNIGLTDFIPTGMSLQDNNWTASGDTARYNTPIAYLASGNSTTIEITMQVNNDFSGTSLMNIAEISSADDDTDLTNTPPTDEDSTPDEDPENTDEDDDDPAVITVLPPADPNMPNVVPEVFDLALTETLAPNQSPMVRPGEEVDFKITVFNQGNVAADTIKLMQYLPEGLTLNATNPQGWTAMDDSTAMILLTAGNGLPNGGLAPDSMLMSMIQVVVTTDATELKLTPYAEINEDGENNHDHDSTPDDDRTNDVGGQINTDTDDVTDLLPPMDEDDHDPVQIMLQQFDLALTEELITEGDVEPGDSITGKIKVFNQGDIPADNIKIFAYIPTGMTLADDSWTAMNDSTAMLTLTVANADLPTGGLMSNTMTMVTIDFIIDPDFMEECLITYAEIGNATDENGNAVTDIDSTPDDDRTNDTGGEVNTTTDNEINETPPTDEDDHDPMKVTIQQIFDLALIIELAPEQELEVNENDTVCFNVKVVNQGSLDAYDIGIVNYVPEGLIFDANLNQNLGHNWQADSTYQLDELASGDTAILPIKFVIDEALMDSIVIDTAEIYFATSEDGSTTNTADIDSHADDSNDDLIGGDDLLNNEMQDEDDHDFVYLINLQDVDPIGFIYAEKTGKIIKGGTISVSTPPGGVAMIIMDGSDGMYKWLTNGVQGEYVMTYTHPDGLIMSPNCTPTAGVYDPTGRDGAAEDMDGDATNGIVQLGTIAVNTDSTYLLNPTCGNNPYYLRFFLQSGDPIIDGNNIAIQESFIGSIVCEDTNGNGQSDAGEDGIPNALVYLYACADTISPIDSTLTNAQGAYNFDGLNAGDYMVQFTAPDGYRLPMDAVPANEIADRGGFSPCINLTIGQCDTTTTVCMTACTEIVATVSASTIQEGESVTISLNGGPDFIWSANTGITNTTTSTVTLSPTTTTTYTVTVEDTYGCSQTLDITITVIPTIVIEHFVRISDPCECTNEEINSTPVFNDRITIYSLTANETWTLTENNGIYNNNNLLSIGSSFIAGEMVDGYFTYSMPIQHLDMAGYRGKFTNGLDTLSAENTCFADQACNTVIVTDPDGTPAPPVVDVIIGIPVGETPILDTLPNCEGTEFRTDGSEDGTLYADTTARNNVLTICATDQWQTLTVNFNQFDLAVGDTLYVYEGKDTMDALIGKYSGAGVSQTGGWLGSSCDPQANPDGCLTFQFKTNGDNKKSIGWRAEITCTGRNIELTPPNDLSAKLDCEETYSIFTIRSATVEADCGTVQDSQIVRIVNGTGVVCLDTILAPTDAVLDTFALGQYLVNYQLKSDPTKTTQATISVQAPSLVCNDEVTIPFGAACSVSLLPDDLLENPCDTLTDTMYYHISLSYLDENGKTKTVSGGGKGGNYPVITKEMLGDCGGTITATIERRYFEGLNLAICNNGQVSAECSTIINVVDQSPPTLMNIATVDTFKLCSANLSPENLGIPTPWAVDNCDSVAVEFVGINVLNDGGACDTTRAQISWRATDACGNSTNATQLVVILRPDANDVVQAPDVVLSCGEDDESAINDLAKTGMPGLRVGKIVNGIIDPKTADTIALDTTNYTCGYILQKRDIQVPADCGVKVFRYWSVLDWCDSNSGITSLDTQFIELRDTLAPAFVAATLETTTINLPHDACTTDLEKLTKPVATDLCSTPIVRLDAVFRVENGELLPVGSTGLDCDSFQVRWVTEDACHTQLINDTLTQIVLVEDNNKPIAICTDQINYSLGRNEGTLHYREIDAGSYDPCGIAKYEVSRDEVNWDSVVTVTCEDAHDEVKVYLRVTDKQGNQNICWMTVNVEDKIAPICADLPDMTGTCDEGHAGDGLTATDTNENGKMDETEWVDMTAEQAADFNTKYGNPDCTDNVACGDLVIEQQYQFIEKSCGIATIKRRYRAIDWDGEGRTSNWAEQTINIESKANWSITLPTDWVGECGADIPNSDIYITNGACDLMAYEVDEKVFTTTEDACLKVVRTFTIINWCIYEAGQDAVTITRDENEHGMVAQSSIITANGYENIGKLEYIQVLKLKDDTAPEITVGNVDNCLEGIDCQDTKRFAITARDCNDAATKALRYTWTISANDAQLATGEGSAFEYPVAAKVTYNVRWTAADNCGNTAWEDTTYEFWDCKKPSPYCLNGVAVELMPDAGMIQVWATDLERNSSDNCTAADKLQFRIWHANLGEEPTDLAGVQVLPEVITFDCTTLGTQTVILYAIDEEGNWDFCVTYVIVQDNMGACTNAQEMAIVSGTIADWKGNMVEDVMVHAMGDMQMMTKEDGQFNFELEMYNNYTIQPEKDDRPLNGVSTFDLVLISKHILGIQQFENPYQMIAADVNGSGTITAFDMVQTRQLILNITEKFANSPSWRFVDATYEFTTNTPMAEDYPQVTQVSDLRHDMVADFVAIKVGDVNGNARPNSLVQAEDRTTTNTFEISTEDKVLKAGETYSIAFSTKQLAEIQGYQFTLGYENLRVGKLHSGVVPIGIGIENFGLHKIEEGMITTSWNQLAVGSEQGNQPATRNSQPATLFTIDFTAERNGKLSEQLNVLDRPTSIEAYDANGDLMDVQLTFTTPLYDQFELFQNTPNPFHDKTMIGFYLPDDSEVQLILRDETGRLLKSIKVGKKAGYNTIQLDQEELTNGFIYYQLTTKFGTQAKKMLKLK